jgi:hypothetical protein
MRSVLVALALLAAAPASAACHVVNYETDAAVPMEIVAYGQAERPYVVGKIYGVYAWKVRYEGKTFYIWNESWPRTTGSPTMSTASAKDIPLPVRFFSKIPDDAGGFGIIHTGPLKGPFELECP